MKGSNWIEGMLLDEYSQSQDVLASLEKQIEKFPKGKLCFRKKRNKKYGRVYEYPCLSYSENGKPVNQHVSWLEFPEIRERIIARDKIISQAAIYRERIKYLGKILKRSRDQKNFS